MFPLVFCAVAAMAASAVAQDEKPYEQTVDLVFAEVHGTGLLMDVFSPRQDKNGLALVDVASGAWHSDRGKIRDHEKAQIYDIFCSRGYTVFAVRPGSRTKYDAEEMANHVKLGIRYVKEHAGEYGIDPERLGLTGASAGGHLASLVALTSEDAKPGTKNPLESHDTRVKAVAVFFPVTDFLDWGGKKPDYERLGTLFFPGGVQGHSDEEIEAQARKVSPVHQVTSEAPPFLIIHGDADPMVPLELSKRLEEALKAAGVPVELIVKPGGAHPWPTIHEEVAVMADWFDNQLKG
jgi:acetyl esterase/lipase